MGRSARARWAAAALGFFGLLCAVLGAVMMVSVPSMIKQQILKNVRIDPTSLSFGMWKEIPVPFYLSVYFFDVVNPNEILQGRKPRVRERGPYVYREYRHKSNITFNSNDTVSFLEFRRFEFQPDKSSGSESDYIVMPNILVLSSAAMVEQKPMGLKLLMTLAFMTFRQRAFMNRTVGEIMWGYDDPLLSIINKYFPGTFPIKGKFGLFAELNNSNSGLFTVFTGIKNFSRIHLVDKWNGLSKVNFWHSDQCNMINGTSGQMWAPFMTPESSLEFYSPDACRSMKLIYKEAGVFEGIPTFRFKAPETLFANGSVYPPNEGFCPCLQSGIQNVSSCRFNAPLFLSHPHFYNGDPVLAEAVLGLHPSEKEHSLFLDIHPATGIPMNCSVKLQLSLYIKAVEGIRQTGNIEPVVLPLVWFEERGAMEGETLQTFYTQLVLIPKVLHYSQYVLLALGAVLLLIPVVYEIRSQGPGDAQSQPSPTTQPARLPSPSCSSSLSADSPPVPKSEPHACPHTAHTPDTCMRTRTQVCAGTLRAGDAAEGTHREAHQQELSGAFRSLLSTAPTGMRVNLLSRWATCPQPPSPSVCKHHGLRSAHPAGQGVCS